MRALLLLVLVLTACTTQPNAGASPTPSQTVVATTAAPSPTPTASASPSSSPIPLPSIAQLSAPSGTVVWALVAGTRLFRSSDRGDTWAERTIPSGVAPNLEVSFTDDKDGLLLNLGSTATQCQTQTAEIWHTADGASTWQKVPATGIGDAMCKRAMDRADALHSFLTTYGPNSGSLVYRSADGGATWTASALPNPPNLASQGSTFVIITGRPRAFGSVVLVDGGGGQQTKDVFRSTDGGVTFSYASTVPTFEGAVAYVSATRWLQIAPPNSSKETTDGGASWHAFTTDYSQAAPVAPDIVFGDALVGYATVRGAIQRTTDGGAHWTTIKTPGT